MSERLIREGDHVEVHSVEAGTEHFHCTAYSSDGTETDFVATKSRPERGTFFLDDECPGAAAHGRRVYHVRTTASSGPPMVNSGAYCERWEEIFKNDGDTAPSA